MPLTGATFVNQARLLLATPNSTTSTRWTDADLLALTDRAIKHVVGKLFFPDSRVTIQIKPYQQLYQTDPRGIGVHQIKRVYVNGQLCAPTTIYTMEGDQRDIYDQSGIGTPTYGSDTPAGAGGGGQPQWSVLTPTTAPYLTTFGPPAPTSQTSYPGQSPRYYLRGGMIGIVPMILPTGYITIDCVLVPDTLTALNQPVILPDEFVDAVVWKVCEYGAFGDSQSPGSADQRNYAAAQYNMELKNLRTWKRQFEVENVAAVPETMRSFWRYGGNRTGVSSR
jgi:hypothetical protein